MRSLPAAVLRLGSIPPALLRRAFARWNWPATRASVVSCEWMGDPEDGREGRPPAGRYRVAYTYSAGGQSYAGSFLCDGVRQMAPYHRGEPLVVQRHPRDPARSHYQEDEIILRGPVGWAAAAIASVAAVLAMLHLASRR